jgi:predicted ester cyclase
VAWIAGVLAMQSDDSHAPTTLGLVRAFYERIWNAGDTNSSLELLVPDFIFRGSLGVEMRGRLEFCGYVRSVRAALRDYRCEILECVTEGDRAFAKMRFSGIHVGPFRGFTPSEKSVQWLGAALFQVQLPLISELWVLGDLISLDENLRANAAA